MGQKGDKMKAESVFSAEELVAKLDGLGDITSKKMFGGHGIFHEGKMFGIIDSKGNAFLKADDGLKSDRVAQGAEQHSRMPYFSIPAAVYKDHDTLTSWAKESIQASK